MKRLSVFLITFMIFISLGCSRHERKEGYRIGISQCSSDPWRWQTNDEIQREMLFHDNVSVEIRSADDISARQISDIKYFIDNKFDLILVNPKKAYSVSPIVKDDFRSGIPVLTFE
ncbi:MAG: histidine kinase, partial [Muribaculaceae bacterium]|nr:histidine kinase [Muribaculaceae bacterium]